MTASQRYAATAWVAGALLICVVLFRFPFANDRGAVDFPCFLTYDPDTQSISCDYARPLPGEDRTPRIEAYLDGYEAYISGAYADYQASYSDVLRATTSAGNIELRRNGTELYVNGRLLRRGEVRANAYG